MFGGRARVFFCNSGAEANEGAIKLARRWGHERHGAACHGIVTAEGSFHGRTLATLAATGQPSKQEAFAPLPPGFTHVPLNDIAALEAAVGPETCAVMLEPVQGEGGVHPCDPGYLAAVRTLCDERGVLLVLDEVQTGLMRCGARLRVAGLRGAPRHHVPRQVARPTGCRRERWWRPRRSPTRSSPATTGPRSGAGR